MKLPVVLFLYQTLEFSITDEIKGNLDFTLEVTKYEDDVTGLIRQISKYNPTVIVTFGKDWSEFNKFNQLTEVIQKKWIHLKREDNLTVETLLENIRNKAYYCYYQNICTTNEPDTPLVSIFTTTYNSGDKIVRAHTSVLDQEYRNWEWVILDDSTDAVTFQQLSKMANEDFRIRVYKAHAHSGYIGNVKNTAVSLSKGSILVELDHDDALTPWCLKVVVETFETNERIGFVYTDFAEIYEDNTSHTYNPGWAMGYGSYLNHYYKNTWMSVANSVNLNPITITNIVGVPNHLRCWRRELYQKIGGHSCDLPVADDYELLLKTFLNTTCVRIPQLCYLQYRNKDEQNFSLIRNTEITKLSNHLYLHYQERIHTHLVENLGNRWEQASELSGKVWEKPSNFIEPHLTFYLSFQEEMITVVISTFNRPQQLKKAIYSVLEQSHLHFEIVIIGDACESLAQTMMTLTTELIESGDSAKLRKIRWWNLDKNYNDGGTTPKNYALRSCIRTQWVSYLDDDNYWETNHLEELVSSIWSHKYPEKISYAFSSFVMDTYTIICTEPKLYRIDTSCLLHRHKLVFKYGYWKSPLEVGYAHDWEMVSRWTDEKYVASRKPTVIYNLENSHNNPQKIAEAYDDQHISSVDQLKIDILDDLNIESGKNESVSYKDESSSEKIKVI